MQCLKCGKETEGEKVFCDSCLDVMDQYPVNPSTPVPAPRAENNSQEKKVVRKRPPTEEETISQLKWLIRLLTVTVAILTVVLCFVAGLLVQQIESNQNTNVIGKNYTTATDTNVSRETSHPNHSPY